MDYEELTAVPVVFSPCDTTKTVTLTTVADGVADGDETLRATLTSTEVDITVPQAIITIAGMCSVSAYAPSHTSFSLWWGLCAHGTFTYSL